jgi:hypothetical protein
MVQTKPGAVVEDAAPTAASVVAETVDAAKAFLKTLEQNQYEKVQYSFTDDKQRENWSNLPVASVPRGGMRWGDMNDKQKAAVMAMLSAALSDNGVQQVVDNMNGDEYLRVNSKRETSFGSDQYFVSFLGEPSTTDPWMFQFGGHHLAINVTIVGEQMTMSPSLTGGQPIDFEWEGKPVRQVADEEDAAYAFIDSLTAEQKKKAVVAGKYGDILFGPGAKRIEASSEGMKASELDEKQLDLLKQLVATRIGILNEVHAASTMEKIVADFPNTWVSWKGPTKAGGDASFRIQSPSILMEYSPQRLGGIPTNHIHAMYRDPSNDYGVGFIEAMRKQQK